MLYTRTATIDDVSWLAPRLREEDKAEIRAGAGSDPLPVLLEGLHDSMVCRVICTDDDVPVGIFGVVQGTTREVGIIWMVATNALHVPSIARDFLRKCKAVVETLNVAWPVLTNVIDARNKLHLKWLQWCGFRMTKEFPQWGAEQRPFTLFERTGDV